MNLRNTSEKRKNLVHGNIDGRIPTILMDKTYRKLLQEAAAVYKALTKTHM